MEQVAFLRDSSTKKNMGIRQLQQLNTETPERKSECREFQGIKKSSKIQRCKVLEYMQEGRRGKSRENNTSDLQRSPHESVSAIVSQVHF